MMNRSAKGWDRSSLHYGGEGVLIHPPRPRCLWMARYGRTARDLRRTGQVSGWHRSKQTYKRKRSGERGLVSRRTAEWYLKRGESHVTGQPATELGRGRQPAKMVRKRKETR
jgi:hypothetical protein